MLLALAGVTLILGLLAFTAFIVGKECIHSQQEAAPRK